MAFRVFVSYSTKDLPVVEQVRGFLRGTGVEVFVAEHSVIPGESLGAKIRSAITGCDLFLVLISRASIESTWVQQEIGLATASGKPAMPVLLERDINLPGFLSGRKYLRAHDDPQQALVWLRGNVYNRAQKKQQTQGLIWLGLAGLFVYLATREG